MVAESSESATGISGGWQFVPWHVGILLIMGRCAPIPQLGGSFRAHHLGLPVLPDLTKDKLDMKSHPDDTFSTHPQGFGV